MAQDSLNSAAFGWAAGFFEGEGSFYCNTSASRRGRPQATLTLSLVQVNKEPIIAFASTIPGGHIYGPYRGEGNRQSHWQYRIHSSKEALNAICLMWSWLSERRKGQASDDVAKWEETQRQRGLMPFEKKIYRVKPGPKPKAASNE